MSASYKQTICFGIPKLHARYRTFVTALLLSIFMSGVVSLISTADGFGLSPQLASMWLSAWWLSWVIAFPVLLVLLPVVHRTSARLVKVP